MKDFREEMKEFRREAGEFNRVVSGHLSDMRDFLASREVAREAALIADRMGMRLVRTLEPQDIIDIWTDGKSQVWEPVLRNPISARDETCPGSRSECPDRA